MDFTKDRIFSAFICAAAVALLSSSTVCAQGISLTGVGPINRSIAGASTALPIDAAGAIHWNPATMSALPSSEAMIGLELLWPETKLSSSVDALGASGSTDGDNGPAPIINAAFVKKKDDNSPLTVGLGFLTVAGFKVDYPADPSNPILAPPPPDGGGLGRVFGSAEIFQLVPALSYQVNDKLSLGVAPTLTVVKLEIVPLIFASPNNDGSFSNGAGNQYAFGGGFQVGAFYRDDNGFSYGASLKSPQWIEDFNFNTVDELGLPRREEIDIDYPLIASAGVSYSVGESWDFALDLRYFDYENTDGFNDSGFGSTGAVQGFGWDSIFAVAAGTQYRASEKLSLRIGYYFSENPIAAENVSFNAASPLIVEHIASLGASYEILDDLILSAGLLYGFENEVSGSLQAPGVGVVPGTSVKSNVYAYAATAGVTVKF